MASDPKDKQIKNKMDVDPLSSSGMLLLYVFLGIFLHLMADFLTKLTPSIIFIQTILQITGLTIILYAIVEFSLSKIPFSVLEITKEFILNEFSSKHSREDSIRLKHLKSKDDVAVAQFIDVSPKDRKEIDLCFKEIHDLNKKIKDRQKEIDLLKSETKELAFETQKVLSILQNRVGNL